MCYFKGDNMKKFSVFFSVLSVIVVTILLSACGNTKSGRNNIYIVVDSVEKDSFLEETKSGVNDFCGDNNFNFESLTCKNESDFLNMLYLTVPLMIKQQICSALCSELRNHHFLWDILQG